MLDSTRERVAANAVVMRDYLRCGARWYLETLRPMLDYPIRERASHVAVPTIVIRGTRDPIARADWVTRLASSMPDATVATLPGPHHVQLVVPRDVASLVRSVARLATRLASDLPSGLPSDLPSGLPSGLAARRDDHPRAGARSAAIRQGPARVSDTDDDGATTIHERRSNA
jgi:hypothetical protein